jgi:hypothetical protein
MTLYSASSSSSSSANLIQEPSSDVSSSAHTHSLFPSSFSSFFLLSYQKYKENQTNNQTPTTSKQDALALPTRRGLLRRLSRLLARACRLTSLDRPDLPHHREERLVDVDPRLRAGLEEAALPLLGQELAVLLRDLAFAGEVAFVADEDCVSVRKRWREM